MKFTLSRVMVLLFLLSSCKTVPNDVNVGMGTVENNSITLNDFPVGVLNSNDGFVHSNFNGKIIKNPLSEEGQKIFNENVVFQFNTSYNLYNKENEVTYYVMIFDFIKSVEENQQINRGDILGKVGEEKIKVLVFSEKLDPYLIISCDNKPYYYDDFYWFNASFLFSTGNTNWFSFNPEENVESILIGMADHATEGPPGNLFYPNMRVRYKTTITDYPVPISEKERNDIAGYERRFYGKNGLTEYVNKIQAGPYTYLLCWQNGFDRYLQNEYKPNNDIWIYGSIVTYDVWDNCGYIFVRDFKLETLEEMYEKRLEIISEE